MTGLSWVTTASQLSGRSQVESGLTGVVEGLVVTLTDTGEETNRSHPDTTQFNFSDNCVLILLSVRTYMFPISPHYIAYLHCRESN